MKKISKYLLSITLIFFVCSSRIYATCSATELKEFNKVKDEYKVTQEIDKASKTYNLYIKVPMPNHFYYQVISQTPLNCKAEDNQTIKCDKVPNGYYEFIVVGITEECDDELKKIELNLTKYNPLSEDPLCEGIEDFIYCRPDYEEEIDYEEFVSLATTYRKKYGTSEKKPDSTIDNQQNENKEEKKQNEFIDKILNYVKDYLIEIIIVVVFVILVVITIIITANSIRKSRRLE